MNMFGYGVAALSIALFGSVTNAYSEVKLGDGTILPETPTYIVTYVEVDPSAADAASTLIKEHSAAGRQKDGNIHFKALRRIGRQNHFVLLEAWNDPAARNAHAQSGETVAFRKALQPSLYNPFDERPHAGLAAVDPKMIAEAPGSAVFAVTHVDIIPPEQFAPCKRQLDPNGPCGNDLVKQLIDAGRSASGNIRFDALTQSNRPNHMTVVEIWDSAASQQAHTASKAVKDFRDALSAVKPGSGVADDPLFVLNPLTGSLYDERLYRSMD
jgi:quinol monooxygenase YgiN